MVIEHKNLRHSYKFYMESTGDKSVSVSVYMKIVLGFIKFLMAKVLDGFEVQLSTGSSLGRIAIKGSKCEPTIDEEGNIKGVPIDWIATNKMWLEFPERKKKREYIYNFNEHSNGVVYRLSWLTSGMAAANTIYSLMFTKGVNGNKRAVSKSVKAGKEYFVKPKKVNNGRQ